jgi:poly(3-hydroxybutyrate) depolymerase
MSTSQVLALVTFISLFTSAYSAPSQACLLPNRSPIDWRPTANETKVFQIGTDPDHPREIRVSVPPLYNGSNVNLPLILAFHDKEQSPAEFEYATRFSDREFNKDKILVYPKAVNVSLHFKNHDATTNKGSTRIPGNQISQSEGGKKIAKRTLKP